MPKHELFNEGAEEARRRAEMAHDIVAQHTHPAQWPLLRLERFAREQPLAAVAAATAVGVAIAVALGRQ